MEILKILNPKLNHDVTETSYVYIPSSDSLKLHQTSCKHANKDEKLPWSCENEKSD